MNKKDESIMPDPPEVSLFEEKKPKKKRKAPSDHGDGGSEVKPEEKEKINQD